MKGTDKNCTPIVDPYSLEIVRRIFEMRAAGYSIKKIAKHLNDEHILVPSDYYYQSTPVVDTVVSAKSIAPRTR